VGRQMGATEGRTGPAVWSETLEPRVAALRVELPLRRANGAQGGGVLAVERGDEIEREGRGGRGGQPASTGSSPGIGCFAGFGASVFGCL
jgi:hypothetical protein